MYRSRLNLVAWLSAIPIDFSHEPSNTHSPARLHHKRKRVDGSLDTAIKARCTGLRQQDTEVKTSQRGGEGGMPSPKKRDVVPADVYGTPRSESSSSRPSKTSMSAPKTPPKSSTKSSSSRPTPNDDAVRLVLEQQGMFFEDEESYDRYPEFQAMIEGMVCGDRNSRMRPESLKRIKSYRRENATQNEKTLFGELRPMVIKGKRSVETGKRTFDEEMKIQTRSFTDDGLGWLQDCLFVKGILPLRNDDADLVIGPTSAKPDWVYGLRRQTFDNKAAMLDNESQSLIGVAPGLQHPFLVIENKGYQGSLESAESQAIRSGASLVAARRRLQMRFESKTAARKYGQPNCPTSDVVGWTHHPREATTSTVSGQPHHLPLSADEAPLQFLATGIPSVPSSTRTSVDSQPPSSHPPQPSLSTGPIGPDLKSFAFSLSWTPQNANLHVHWCERRAPDAGPDVYHMNFIRTYSMRKDCDILNFRRDIHNILDWGVSAERKRALGEIMVGLARDTRSGT